MIIKCNKNGMMLLKNLVGLGEFKKIIKDKGQYLLINNNGAVMAECTVKFTEFLEENNIDIFDI